MVLTAKVREGPNFELNLKVFKPLLAPQPEAANSSIRFAVRRLWLERFVELRRVSEMRFGITALGPGMLLLLGACWLRRVV